mmetsp:Transcript_21547/g.51031  ORF Transcript_21547/g.51031 Transcript_21547/m.51031 type:complete len:335 (-) Transcript_21547:2205-3209(-)
MEAGHHSRLSLSREIVTPGWVAVTRHRQLARGGLAGGGGFVRYSQLQRFLGARLALCSGRHSERRVVHKVAKRHGLCKDILERDGGCGASLDDNGPLGSWGEAVAAQDAEVLAGDGGVDHEAGHAVAERGGFVADVDAKLDTRTPRGSGLDCGCLDDKVWRVACAFVLGLVGEEVEEPERLRVGGPERRLELHRPVGPSRRSGERQLIQEHPQLRRLERHLGLALALQQWSVRHLTRGRGMRPQRVTLLHKAHVLVVDGRLEGDGGGERVVDDKRVRDRLAHDRLHGGCLQHLGGGGVELERVEDELPRPLVGERHPRGGLALEECEELDAEVA